MTGASSRPPDEAPRVDIDPFTGRPVLMAPGRRRRPIHTAEGDDRSACPFCSGHEHLTPPEVDAERDPGTTADAPGWHARAFANLYPAAAAHEVIAEGAEHAVQPSDLPAATWERVLALWRRRIAAMEARPEVGCAFLFKNVGLRAGASVAHNHSQLLGLADLTPRLQLLVQRTGGLHGGGPFRTELDHAAGDGRLLHRADGALALCPRTPKLPFETWVLPADLDDDFLAPRHPAAVVEALRAVFVAFDRAFGGPPFNMYLLRDPHRRIPWHIELQPRTGNLAGLELGGDTYINSVPAAEAAARLRDALAH